MRLLIVAVVIFIIQQSTNGQFGNSTCPDGCTCVPPYVSILINNTKPDSSVNRLLTNNSYEVSVNVNMECSGGVKPLEFFCTFAGMTWKRKKKIFKRSTVRKLIEATYPIKCQVKLSGGVPFYSASVVVDIAKPDLVAMFSAEYITTRRGKFMILLKASSIDHDLLYNRCRGLKYTWFCRLNTETFPRVSNVPVDRAYGRQKKPSHGCFGYGPGRLTTIQRDAWINVNKIERNRILVFMLFISKDRRNATTAHRLLPTTGPGLRCTENCGDTVNVTRRMVLTLRCESLFCKRMRHHWSLYKIGTCSLIQVHGVNRSISTTRDSASLGYIGKVSLNEISLEADTRYKISVTSYQGYYVKDTSSLIFMTNPIQPGKGRCSVSPTQGISLVTQFSFKCVEYLDQDASLSYIFKYHTKSDTVIFYKGQAFNTSAVMPLGNPNKNFSFVVEMVVEDAFGDALDSVFITLTVSTPKSLNADAVDELLDTKDPDEAMQNALAILSVVDTPDGVDGGSKTRIQIKEKVMNEMVNVTAKTLADVTKLAAIVIMATQEEEEIKPTIQANALVMLDDMTTFTSQWKDRKDDPARVKEVGSTLLRGISNVMSVAITDTIKDTNGDRAGVEEIKAIEKTLELADKMGSVLLETMIIGENPQKFKTDSFLMELGKHLPLHAGGEISDGVLLPSPKVLFADESESRASVSSQLIKFPNNPYNWDSSSRNITSSVVDFSLKYTDGSTLEVTGLTKPVELYIPRNTSKATDNQLEKDFFAKSSKDGTEIRYHHIFIPSDDVSVSITVTPSGNRSAVVYVSAKERPTPTSRIFRTVLPNRMFCQNSQELYNCSREAYTFAISSGITGATGLHYIGIGPLKSRERDTGLAEKLKLHLRSRRDCGSRIGRWKRSCIGVKDPPSTVPPITIIRPIYNSNTDVNYTMSVNIASCKYWSNKTNKWTSQGCKAGPKSVPDKIQCLCTHLSAFGGNVFVSPNPIDFDVVWARLPDLGQNFDVLATICTIFAIYFLCLIYARRADKKDHAKIVANVILACESSDTYQYQIYIRTGIWRGYGTSAKVGMVMYGENGRTDNIYLTDAQLRKKFFARASVNHFTLYLPESLGELYKIKLWHDDTGKNSSWFVQDVCIVDSQTTDEWNFLARKWLSVDKEEGDLKVELRAADDEQLKNIGNLTYSRAMKNFADGHLWFSIFSKPPHSTFTRCQRLSCCLSTLFAAMVANAMFYQFGKKAEDTFKVGPLQVSWTQIMIGIQSSLVAVPINVVLVLIFRNIKQSNTNDCYNVVTAEQKKRLGFMPHFFVYVAWALCLATSITSAAFVFFYSIYWGKEISGQWLTSIMVSLFGDILVLQPFKVLLLASLLSIILRKVPQIDKIYGPSLWKPRKASETSASGAKAAELAFKGREDKKKVLKMYRKIAEMASFLVFVILLMIVCYGNRSETRYMITRSIEETFSEFEKVSETRDFWKWTRDTLVPGLYAVTWYNGQPFDQEGFISTREAFMIGMPRLRQIRAKYERECHVGNPVLQETFERCLPFNMANDEDTTAFQTPGWVPVRNARNFRSDFELLRLCPKPWRYHTARELQTTSFQGQAYSYGGGGYVADLGYTSKSANEVIDNLEKNVWIDDKTSGVFVEFAVFEPSTSLVTSVKYLYERLATGQTNTVTKVKTLTLYTPADPHFRGIYEICQLLFILVILLLLFGEIVNFLGDWASYFKHFWNWVEMIEIISAVLSLVMFFLKEKYTSGFVKNVRDNPFQTSSADYLVLWSDLEIDVLSFVIFIVTIKLLRIIRYNRHVCQMMATMKRSWKPLVSFSAVFITALLGFTHFGYLVFGHHLEAYSSYSSTLRAMLIMTVGGRMYYIELITVDKMIACSFLFVYMLVIGCLLMNLFVTILMDTYTDVGNHVSGDKDFTDADLGDFMAKYILKYIKDVRRKVASSWKGLTWRRRAGFIRKSNTIQRKRSHSGEILRHSNRYEVEDSENVELITVAAEIPSGIHKSDSRKLRAPLASMGSQSDLYSSNWHDILMIYAEEELSDDVFVEDIVQCFSDYKTWFET